MIAKVIYEEIHQLNLCWYLQHRESQLVDGLLNLVPVKKIRERTLPQILY